ncbi:MAG TPA: hypothetical protein P5119_05085 [Candidatus Aminicenantes bacterium]|nr:hypothetical protein [Candidatus Aminicenantes bacterium]HRY64701.1 hypothetical protein [Candidatus Aminicenantes bacterium]HRZ71614.1 hypothetical protein [Candidatus Aminicenantes bacterium]
MASRKIGVASALCALGLALAAFASSGGQAEAAKPLVRRDLLVFGPSEQAPPLRDIFRPKFAAAPAADLRPARAAAKPIPGAPAGETAPAFALNISYIGAVKAGGQTIALVLRGGQTLSVKEGEEIAPGYKVISLTAEAIVVQGPGGETKTFPRQGD